MKIPRFLITHFDFSESQVVLTDKTIFHQITKVLRLVQGDQIIIFDGLSKEATFEITGFANHQLTLTMKETHQNHNELKREIVLYSSLIKKDLFEMVVQKATELGVKKIVPLITQRTVKLNLNIPRMEKIIKEACEQSGRSKAPSIQAPVTFTSCIEAKECETNLFFDPSGKTMAGRKLPAIKKIGIWIGPEGGWTEQELQLAQQHNFKIISFGGLIFRAETAAIVGCYLATI